MPLCTHQHPCGLKELTHFFRITEHTSPCEVKWNIWLLIFLTAQCKGKSFYKQVGTFFFFSLIQALLLPCCNTSFKNIMKYHKYVITLNVLVSVMLITNERPYYYLLVELIDTRHEIKLKLYSSSKPQRVINQVLKVIVWGLWPISTSNIYTAYLNWALLKPYGFLNFLSKDKMSRSWNLFLLIWWTFYYTKIC